MLFTFLHSRVARTYTNFLLVSLFYTKMRKIKIFVTGTNFAPIPTPLHLVQVTCDT